MNPRSRSPRRVIIGLVLLAAALLVHSTMGFGRSDDSQSLTLRADGQWVESPAFKISTRGGYRTSLTIDRKFPFKETECLAGVGMPYAGSTRSGPRTDCPKDFFPPALQWSILEGGRALRSTTNFGPNAGEYASDSVGRSLGMYELRPDAHYVLRARISNSSTHFAATNPRLDISFGDPVAIIVSRLFFSLIASAAALIGFVLLVIQMWRLAKGRAQFEEAT